MRMMQWFQEVEKHTEIAAAPGPGMRMAAWLAALPPMRTLRARLIVFGGWRPERVRPLEANGQSAEISRPVRIRMAAAAHRDRY
jgi:hypothetical protein